MNAAIETMLSAYNIENLYDRKNAMKEIIQEIVLCGLSRAGFFRRAAFYGGTALRIFYGLDRFSEDLDFSLDAPDEDFTLLPYFDTLEKEVRAFGLSLTVAEKEKTADSHIRSAFLKGNTKEHLLLFYPNESAGGVAANETIKIKFEIDTLPPAGAVFEHKYRLLPSPYEVRLYDMPSLFAGKIHAVLCRGWQNRVKGRDLYDYIFYLSRRTPVDLPHLSARLAQSGRIAAGELCSIEDVRRMLEERFAVIDFAQAKEDVAPFIHDTAALSVWNADFFIQITASLHAR